MDVKGFRSLPQAQRALPPTRTVTIPEGSIEHHRRRRVTHHRAVERVADPAGHLGAGCTRPGPDQYRLRLQPARGGQQHQTPDRADRFRCGEPASPRTGRRAPRSAVRARRHRDRWPVRESLRPAISATGSGRRAARLPPPRRRCAGTGPSVHPTPRRPTGPRRHGPELGGTLPPRDCDRHPPGGTVSPRTADRAQQHRHAGFSTSAEQASNYRARQHQLTGLSPRGKHITTGTSSLIPHISNPSLVVETICVVVAEALPTT